MHIKNLRIFAFLLITNIFYVDAMEPKTMHLIPFLTPNVIIDAAFLPLHLLFWDITSMFAIPKAQVLSQFMQRSKMDTYSFLPSIVNSLVNDCSEQANYYLEEFFKHNTNPNVCPVSLWDGQELAPWQTASECNNAGALDICFKYGLLIPNKIMIFKKCIGENKPELLDICLKNGMRADLVTSFQFKKRDILYSIIKDNKSSIMKVLIENGLSRLGQEYAFAQIMNNILQRSPLLVQLFFLTPHSYPDRILKIGLTHLRRNRSLTLKDRCIDSLCDKKINLRRYTYDEKKLTQTLIKKYTYEQMERDVQEWNSAFDHLAQLPVLIQHSRTVLSFKIQDYDQEIIHTNAARSINEQLDEMDWY